MANTATLLSATPQRMVYTLIGDGTVAGPTIASATLITNSVAGPLRNALSASYANQAAMRAAFFGSPNSIRTQLRTSVNDVTAERNQVAADVDVDAVTPARPEINVTMSDTTGQEAYLVIEHVHSPSL